MPIKVAIYEDNAALREGLQMLVESAPELELTGAFENPEHVLIHCEVYAPDVILMDIDMPVMTGIQATELVKTNFPDVEIMMQTVYEEKDKIFAALQAGATGYMLKKSSAADVIEGIISLAHGGAPMDASIARKVLEFFTSQKQLPAPDYDLSKREMDLLKCLVEGDSYKMIAAKLFISTGTVRVHIMNIYRKLQVNSKSEAVAKALKEKIVAGL
ncbi:MAG TPA: response regulator transcription factor [Phnomibacter sp.]|nr:response regulator transcription factor [Phnomibacter sp.]